MNLDEKTQTQGKVVTKDFIIELAKYFMQFLETDFKKRRQPKRNLSSRVNKGLAVGLYLDKYPSLHKEIYKNVIAGFEKESFEVHSGQYVTKIPDSLRELVSHRIDQLSKDDAQKAIGNICDIVDRARLENTKTYDLYLEEATTGIKQQIATFIITPFIKDVEKPLQAAGLSTEAGLYQLEVDATEKLFSVFEGSLETTLKTFFADNQPKASLEGYFKDLLSEESVKKLLKEFFGDFSTADAYSEIYQLHRNKEMLDKTELYVYFCEISIGNFSFPLFYSPITTQHSGSDMILEMDNRIFVNTKAVEFVIQEFNEQTGNRESIGNKLDRIIYVENKKDLVPKLQEYVDIIGEVLDVGSISIREANSQSKANLIVKINNRLQLFLFDKSDEALINDYEEIIQDQGEITEAFTELINGFIADNPQRYIEEVADEWEETSIPERLVIQSPIPLNEEQKQVMLALGKDNCKVVILEGPPGTGKSHTITAVVCRALLEGQSVLVLSDKDEALDVVQDKITETLNKVRHDKNFQNPILRLGRNSGGLAKVIEGQVLERVREHFRAYKSQKNKLEELTSDLEGEAKGELNRLAEVSSRLSLKEIQELVKKEVKYEDINWLDTDNVTAVGDDLKRLHESISFIADNDANYLLAYSNKTDLRNVEDYLNHLNHYLKTKQDLGKPDSNFIAEYKRMDESTRKGLVKKLKVISEDSKQIFEYLSKNQLLLLHKSRAETTLSDYGNLKKQLNTFEDIANSALSYLGDGNSRISHLLKEISKYENSSVEVTEAFSSYVESARSLRSKLFGYSGKGNQLLEIERQLKKKVPYFNISSPEKHIVEIQLIADFVGFVSEKLKQYNIEDKYWSDIVKVLTISADEMTNNKQALEVLSSGQFDEIIGEYTASGAASALKNIELLECAGRLLHTARDSETVNALIKLDNLDELVASGEKYVSALEKLSKDYQEFSKFDEHTNVVSNFITEYPEVAEKLGLNGEVLSVEALDPKFRTMKKNEVSEYIDFFQKVRTLHTNFVEITTDDYLDLMQDIETLTTAKMAHLLDSRIIEYVDGHAADIRTLKNLLRSKQKFPKALFGDLKQAFPCILAGIRDYATYIPLEQDLFDLVIIDEASQVSIAQALPALIRGKKILVLGDDKQFSNVKAGNASKLTNDQMKNQVLSSLRDSIGGYDREVASIFLSRAKDNFDIKNSVLEFCRFIANYEIMLKKHFRCYPEVISYSNKHFYGDELQCMKARALPVGEVIKFDKVEHDGMDEQYKDTNTPELNFIIDQLKGMKERNYNGTIGVITPHRPQASLIHTTLTTSDIADWLEERKLKVMTFDTCQGEERDYIFYSMVATEEDDKHRYIFPQNLESMSDIEESRVRVQRLNVGFSRAKETVHFVLSKDTDKYWGAVRSALAFYEQKLSEASSIVIGGTDPASKMESKIQHYFYETKFYKESKEKIELIPQFPLGDYLRSLDRKYNHPSYKVDFLLLYGKQKIVIEYDGFKEHFVDGDGINKDNYESYLKPEDVYRQKVLEGYGYKFVRPNKFNLGNNPIEAFDEMLSECVKKKTQARQLLMTS